MSLYRFISNILICSVGFMWLPCQADTVELESCNWLSFFEHPPVPGIISAEGRTYFYDNPSDCSHNKSACRSAAYLVKGDHVLVAQQNEHQSCVWFGSHQRWMSKSGWVARDHIESVPLEPISASSFVGEWLPLGGKHSEKGSWIKISQQSDGQLRVKGKAFWPAEDIAPYHIGEISDDDGQAASTTLQGNTLVWGDHAEDFECAGSMQLINGALVVKDNNNCGGANVSFTDIYMRTTRHFH